MCKNKISRLNYYCPDCNALYCVNCAEVLSNTENACWVCDTPFDESKPVKPYKREEEKVYVEEETQKGGKDNKDFKSQSFIEGELK